MRVLSTLAFCSFSALALVACGGDDGNTILPIDASGSIDGPGSDGAVPCTISTPSFGAAGALTASAYFASDPNMPALYKISFTAPLEPTIPQDIFFFEVFTGYEPFGTSTAPTPAIAGTYQIAGNQLQYADCSVCLTLGSNATADSYEDDFMATGGTVNITEIGDAVGENLNVTFSNLTFEQVTIASSTSTPVGNGCTTSIESASFTAQLMAPPPKPGQAVYGPVTRLH